MRRGRLVILGEHGGNGYFAGNPGGHQGTLDRGSKAALLSTFDQFGTQLRNALEVASPRMALVQNAEFFAAQTNAGKALHAIFTCYRQRQVVAAGAIAAVIDVGAVFTAAGVLALRAADTVDAPLAVRALFARAAGHAESTMKTRQAIDTTKVPFPRARVGIKGLVLAQEGGECRHHIVQRSHAPSFPDPCKRSQKATVAQGAVFARRRARPATEVPKGWAGPCGLL